MKWRSLIGVLLTLSVLIGSGLFGAAPAHANQPIVVNNSTDDAPDRDPGDGACETDFNNDICTLRAAIMEANGREGADSITIPPGTYNLTRAGIDNEDALFGDLDITDDLTISGAGTGII